MSRQEIENRVLEDLARLGLVKKDEVLGVETRSFEYAYVIYDLDHRKNVDRVLAYLKSMGIRSAGRFAEFEYLNTDGVVEHTLKLAEELNGLQQICRS